LLHPIGEAIVTARLSVSAAAAGRRLAVSATCCLFSTGCWSAAINLKRSAFSDGRFSEGEKKKRQVKLIPRHN
jgi:hypothetical protein